MIPWYGEVPPAQPGLSASVSACVGAACGCNTLYSEDLQHGQLFDEQLTVVNPFLV
jgi:predicted nucleic acid-binding protein